MKKKGIQKKHGGMLDGNFEFDKPLFFAILLLVGIGLIMIASAGVFYGRARFDDPYYFFKEQLVGLSIGLALLYFFQRFSYRRLKKVSVPFFLASLILLVCVFVPGIGTTVYGAARWVEFGPISFQPSEVMKLAIILYLAAWFSGKGQEKTADFFEGFVPFLGLLSIVGFLIIKQPDTGTLGLIFLVALSIFYASGARLNHLFLLFLSGLTFLFVLIKIAPYRLQRFLVFINPEHDPLGFGYQMTQALVAIGSGGLLGVGLGHSRQKFNYLPEPVTDSIFAVLGEEFGLAGCIIVIGLFVLVAWRGIRIARGAPDEFGKLIAVGIVSWIVFQAFINMSAISGLIPLTGIPMPFISYGGTSLIVLLSAVGILLNISKHSTLRSK